MTHSLIGADRGTHLKIVSVALASAIVVTMVGVMSRLSQMETPGLKSAGPAAKAEFVHHWSPSRDRPAALLASIQEPAER